MRKVLLAFIASLFVSIGYAAPTVITDQPAGELKTYKRSGVGYWNLWGYWKDVQDGKITQLVFAEDGKTVYWKDPLSFYAKGSWIKGELSSDGSQIVFAAGQYLTYDEEDMYGYQLYHINSIVLDEDEYLESFNVDRNTPIVLSVDGSTLKLEGTSDSDIIASVTDDDEPHWNYYADAMTVLTPFDATPVTAPEGLATSTYMMHYGKDGSTKKIVNIGTDGADFYVQGIYTGCPEAWLKGTIDGNTVTLNSGQYFGTDEGSLLYWVAATTEQVWNEKWEMYDTKYIYADKITFELDPATGIYSSDIVLLANGGDGSEGIDRFGTFFAPRFIPFKEVATVPADPEIDEFREAEEEEGYIFPASIGFYINTVDVDSVDINADKLYYRLYIDNDQLFTLKPESYEMLEEEMSEFRYDFTDKYDFYIETSTGYHQIYLYDEFKRIGVQAVYRGGGEERVSNIVYNDGTVTPTGISAVKDQGGDARTEYFDLSGRRISKSAQGRLVIRRTVDASGNTTTSKVIGK